MRPSDSKWDDMCTIGGIALMFAGVGLMRLDQMFFGVSVAAVGWILTTLGVPRPKTIRRKPKREAELLLGKTIFESDVDGYGAKAVRLGDRVTVVIDGVPPDVALFPRTRRGGGFRTGDTAFDDQFVAEGKPLTLQSLLDAKVRKAWLDALAAYPGIRVDGGRVLWTGTIANSQAEPIARELAGFALALEGADVRARLEESSSHDPLASVRLRGLDILLRRFSSSDEAVRAARAALRDTDPAMRLRGALFAPIAASQEAVDVLVRLTRDAKSPTAVRASALAAAASALPRDRAGELALEIATDPAYEASVRDQAIGLVATLAPARAVTELVRCLGRFPSHRAPIAAALGRLGDRAAEPGLIKLLELRDPAVQRAAIVALALVGTAESVEKLRAIPGREAERAVAAIQARLVGAGAGQLSVAGGDEAGHLSLPEDAAGRVSMATAKPVPASRSSR